MKKKVLAMLLSVSMISAMFTGCGQATPAESATDGVTMDESQEDSNMPSTESVEEPVPEPIEMVTVEIGEKGYDSVIQASDDYMFVYENGKYGAINLSGEEVLPIEYDGYGANMQDGCFCLGYKTSDSTWDSYIFDSDLQVKFQNRGYEGYYFASYHEDVFELVEVTPKEGVADRLYVYTKLDGQPGYVMSENAVAGYMASSAVNNGMIMIQTFTRSPEGTFSCMFNPEDKLVQGPAWWTAFPYAQTDSGYINGICFDSETGTSLGMAVYNTKTDQMVQLPSEIVVTKVMELDGITVTSTEDGFMAVQNTSSGPLAVYSIQDANYCTDYKYGYVGMRKHDNEDYILVANEDSSQWGYLDKEMKECGTWYADATDFTDGKAIIKDTDGLLYVVDSSFNKISEGFEGEGAAAVGDIANRFVVYREDKCYLVTVK